MEINESITSWKLRRFTQHGGFLFCKDALLVLASITTIVAAVIGVIYAGPDSTTGKTISDKASQVLESKPHDNSTTLNEETRNVLSEIVAHESKDITEETALKLIKATKEMAPPADCHFPWRQNACVNNILENLQKRTSSE